MTPAIIGIGGKIKSWEWPQTVTYCLVALATGIFIFNQIPWKQVNPTPREIENIISQWAFDAGFNLKKNKNKKEMYFSLTVINQSGRPVEISMWETQKTLVKIGKGLKISDSLREKY